MGDARSIGARRLGIALAIGVVAGLLCYLGGLYVVGIEPGLTIFFWILLNRAMIGFVIGISGLRMHWSLHGMLVGLIVGSIFLFYVHMNGKASPLIVVAVGLLNLLFGLMIEFFTSVVFGARRTGPART